MKDRLINPIAKKFAIQECTIHSHLDHDNIPKLFGYTETKDEYVLYMELCDRADYLASKILEVDIILIKSNVEPQPDLKQ